HPGRPVLLHRRGREQTERVAAGEVVLAVADEVAVERVGGAAALELDLPIADRQELGLALVGAPRAVAEIADQLRNEDVRLTGAHALDVRRERVVIADRDPRRVVLVAADGRKTVAPAVLGSLGVAEEREQRGLL